jgi:hypothetical protein
MYANALIVCLFSMKRGVTFEDGFRMKNYREVRKGDGRKDNQIYPTDRGLLPASRVGEELYVVTAPIMALGDSYIMALDDVPGNVRLSDINHSHLCANTLIA